MTTLQAVRPAAIWKRVVAGVIDFFILWMLVWPPVCLLGFGDVDREIEFARTTFGRAFPFVLFMGLWLFPYCLRDLVGGRSFGKWLLGLRVADAADPNAALSSGRLILRNATIWFSPVGMVSAYMNPDKMRFGDRLAGTLVVEDHPSGRGPSWGQTVTRGVFFAALAGGCLYFGQKVMGRYYEGSRVFRSAATFLDGCAELRELMPGASSDNLTLKGFRYGPNAEGAGAQIGYGGELPGRTLSVTVVMRRPADKVTAWRGVAAQVVFDPGWETDKLSHSVLNASAMSCLKGYAPLHEAIRDLRPESARLTDAVVFTEKDVLKARAAYLRAPDRWSARFEVALERRSGAWEAWDASGLVDLNIDNAATRRAFIFLKSKDVHRYLTAGEMEAYLRGGRSLTEVLPELRPSADNTPATR